MVTNSKYRSMCSHLPSEKSFHVRLKREREKRKEGREGGKNVIDSVYKTRSDILQGASGEEKDREREGGGWRRRATRTRATGTRYDKEAFRHVIPRKRARSRTGKTHRRINNSFQGKFAAESKYKFATNQYQRIRGRHAVWIRWAGI